MGYIEAQRLEQGIAWTERIKEIRSMGLEPRAISKENITRRINRRLRRRERKVIRKSGSPWRRRVLGNYYTTTFDSGRWYRSLRDEPILDTHVDLLKWAKKYYCISEDEFISQVKES